MYRTLIVDDEPLARERVRTLLAADAEVDVVGECGNGQEAVAAIDAERPDLVFLDVQMPELDGFGVLEAVDAARLPAVVFVTAYDAYALRAFDVHAVDYLLKPFTRARFQRALERAKASAGRGDAAAARGGVDERVLALLEDIRAGRPGSRYAERLVVKTAGRVFFLRTAEIDWVEAAGNYVKLHARGEGHLLRETMKNLEARLDPAVFVRIQRSAMVNIDRITQMEPWFHGEYVVFLTDGTRLTSSRGYSDRLHALLK